MQAIHAITGNTRPAVPDRIRRRIRSLPFLGTAAKNPYPARAFGCRLSRKRIRPASPAEGRTVARASASWAASTLSRSRDERFPAGRSRQHDALSQHPHGGRSEERGIDADLMIGAAAAGQLEDGSRQRHRLAAGSRIGSDVHQAAWRRLRPADPHRVADVDVAGPVKDHSIAMPSIRDGAEGPAIHWFGPTTTSPIPATWPRRFSRAKLTLRAVDAAVSLKSVGRLALHQLLDLDIGCQGAAIPGSRHLDLQFARRVRAHDQRIFRASRAPALRHRDAARVPRHQNPVQSLLWADGTRLRRQRSEQQTSLARYRLS